MARHTLRINYVNVANSDQYSFTGGEVVDIVSGLGSVSSAEATVTAQLATVTTNADTNAGSLGVTDLNTDYTAMTAILDPLVTYTTGDLVVSFNASTLNSKNKLVAALRKAIRMVDEGFGGLS